MDQPTQARLMDMLSQQSAARGIQASASVFAEFQRLLAGAKDVPPGRFNDAADALEILVADAIKAGSSRGFNQALSAADLRDGLASLCPIWPCLALLARPRVGFSVDFPFTSTEGTVRLRTAGDTSQ